MRRMVFSFLLLLLGVSRLFADWSPEILLWENPDRISGGETQAYFLADSLEHVHFVYSHEFRMVANPTVPRTQLLYLQLDDHGRVLAGPTLINDSTDHKAATPKIVLFGQDSLWIMWYSDRPDTGKLAIRALDLAGTVLGPIRTWRLTYWPQPEDYLLGVSSDRTVAFVSADIDLRHLFMTVQRPDGSRIHDCTLIWDQLQCQRAQGFVDGADTLQVLWEQDFGYLQYAEYAKRIAFREPFPVSQLNTYHALTPENGAEGVGYMTPLADSLLLFMGMASNADGLIDSMHVFQRDNYTQIHSASVGLIWGANPPFVLQGDTALSCICFVDTAGDLHYHRYSLPDLAPTEDTLFIRSENSQFNSYVYSYYVSPAGVRHVVYSRRSCNGDEAGCFHLYYRFWRSDSTSDAVSDAPPPVLPLEAYAVYPNPANSTFVLSGPLGQLTGIHVYNLLGQRVQSVALPAAALAGGSVSIDLQNQPSGTYLLQLVRRDRIHYKHLFLVR